RARPRGARAARRTGKLRRAPARLICDSLYRLAVPDRLPSPGPSFLREQRLDVGDRHLSVGMSRPTTTEDEWWLAIVWVADAEGIVSFVDLAPAAGPRPEPPLTRLGPTLAAAPHRLVLYGAARRVSPAPSAAEPPRTPAASAFDSRQSCRRTIRPVRGGFRRPSGRPSAGS